MCLKKFAGQISKYLLVLTGAMFLHFYAVAQSTEAIIKIRKLMRSEHYAKALPLLDTYIMLNPSSSEAYAERGLCLRKTGDYQGSEANLKYAIQLDTTNANAYCYLGSTYAITKKIELAQQNFDKSIALNPFNPTSYNSRGAFYAYFLDKNDSALADYNKAIHLNPTGYQAYFNRAIVYRIKGRPLSALTDLKTAKKLHHKDNMIFNELGLVYMALDENRKAIRSFKKAIRFNKKLDPFENLSVSEMYTNIAECYENSNKNSKAALYYEKAKVAK